MKINRVISSLFLVSKLEALDWRLDAQSFRVSRIEDRVESFKFRGTVNFCLVLYITAVYHWVIIIRHGSIYQWSLT